MGPLTGRCGLRAAFFQFLNFILAQKRLRFARFQGRVTELPGLPQMRLKPFCEFARIVAFQPAEPFCGILVRQDFSDAWTRLVNLSVRRDGTGDQMDWRTAQQHHVGNEPVWQAQDEKPLAVGSVESYLDRVPGFESQGSAHRRRQHHAQPARFFGAQAAYLRPRRLRHRLARLQRDCLHPVFVRHEQAGRPGKCRPAAHLGSGARGSE